MLVAVACGSPLQGRAGPLHRTEAVRVSAVPARVDDLVSTGKLGPIGVQERARSLGGALLVHPIPGAGTEVAANVPLRPQPEDADSDRERGDSA